MYECGCPYECPRLARVELHRFCAVCIVRRVLCVLHAQLRRVLCVLPLHCPFMQEAAQRLQAVQGVGWVQLSEAPVSQGDDHPAYPAAAVLYRQPVQVQPGAGSTTPLPASAAGLGSI
jgi:hypothetical protein